MMICKSNMNGFLPCLLLQVTRICGRRCLLLQKVSQLFSLKQVNEICMNAWYASAETLLRLWHFWITVCALVCVGGPEIDPITCSVSISSYTLYKSINNSICICISLLCCIQGSFKRMQSSLRAVSVTQEHQHNVKWGSGALNIVAFIIIQMFPSFSLLYSDDLLTSYAVWVLFLLMG